MILTETAFQLHKFLKNQNLLQTNVSMCKAGMSFTNVEQKFAWEYLEAYLRYSNVTILSILSSLQLLKFLKNQKFAANHCEYV